MQQVLLLLKFKNKGIWRNVGLEESPRKSGFTFKDRTEQIRRRQCGCIPSIGRFQGELPMY